MVITFKDLDEQNFFSGKCLSIQWLFIQALKRNNDNDNDDDDDNNNNNNNSNDNDSINDFI